MPANAEERLLFSLASPWGSDEVPAGPVDWPSFLHLANAHHVLPLVYRNLEERERDSVPAAVLEGGCRWWEEHLKRCFLAAQELLDLLAAFEKAGIAALPLKGPVLAVQLFGDVAARQFDDLDLWVSPEQLDSAKKLLEARGYTVRHSRSPRQDRASYRVQGHIPLSRKDPAIHVDLHQQPMPVPFDRNFDFSTVWRRSVSMTLAGQTVRVLGPEDLLLFLCAHGAKHLFERLSWVLDAACWIDRAPGIDWDRTRSRAAELGMSRTVAVSFSLIGKLLGRPLPGPAARLFPADDACGRAAEWMMRVSFGTSPGRVSSFRRFFFMRRMAEGAGNRFRFTLEAIGSAATPTPEEWGRFPLPDPLFFLYYGIRPLRLAWRYARWR